MVVLVLVLRLLTPHSDFHRTVQCIRLVLGGEERLGEFTLQTDEVTSHNIIHRLDRMLVILSLSSLSSLSVLNVLF